MNNKRDELNTEQQKIEFSVNVKSIFIFAVCIAFIIVLAQFETIKNIVDTVVDILFPVFVGVVLAYIINPLDNLFERLFIRALSKSKRLKSESLKRISRGLAIILSVVVLISVIVLLIFLILPEFLDSLNKLIDIAPDLFENVVVWVQNIENSEYTIVRNLGGYLESVGDTFTNWLSTELASAVAGVIGSLISVVSFLFDFLIALVICVYALIEKKKFVGQCKKLLFAVLKPSRANDILDVARYGNEVFGKFIIGKLITSTVVGITTFCFMSIMGMPYALLSAGIIAVTNVIPFFGPFIGGIPTALIVLLTDVKQGIIYIIFLVVLQQLEGNVIEPMIMEDRTGVSKFWITTALLLFGGVFGLAGMIFSVPLIAVLFYIIRIYTARSLTKKSLPLSSEEYTNVGSVDIETGKLCPPPQTIPRKNLRATLKEWRARVRHKDENGENTEE